MPRGLSITAEDVREGLVAVLPSSSRTRKSRARRRSASPISDAEKTDQAIQTFMGRDVVPRFEFITARAPKLDEVDV